MMKRSQFALLLVSVLSLAFAVSCSTAYNPPSGEASPSFGANSPVTKTGGADSFNRELLLSLGKIKTRAYHLMPGDVVVVSVFGIDELKELTGTVDALQKVTLPLVGSVKIGGLTIPEAKKCLEKTFKEYVGNPKVSLEVKEYNGYRASVLGEVNKPDVYSLKGTRTILDAIAMAGGLTKEASRTVILTHLGADKRSSYVIDLNKLVRKWNITEGLLLHPGDIVYVPKARNIFVDGFVKHPGAFPMTEPITLSQAITWAGGMKIDADPSKVAIYRKSLSGKRTVTYADIDKMRNGEERDIPLEPDDIVVVPSSGIKVFVYHFFGIGVGPTGPTVGAAHR